MMELMLVTIILVMALPYSYFLTMAVSRAYFQSKIDYHRMVITNLSRGEHNAAEE